MAKLLIESNPGILKTVLNILGAANPQTVLSFGKEDVSVCSMDAQHVIVEVASMQTKGFDVYNLISESDNEENFDIGVNISSILAWIGMAKEDERVIWKADKEKHEIIIAGQKGQDRRFMVAAPRGIPKWDSPVVESPYQVELLVKPNEFLNVLSQCAIVGDELIMRVKKDGITFETGEFSTGNVKIETTFDADFLAGQPKISEEIEMRASLTFMRAIISNLSSLGDQINVKFGKETPIFMNVARYTIPVVKQLDFYLSPIAPPE